MTHRVDVAIALEHLKHIDPILASLIDTLEPYSQKPRQPGDNLLSALTRAIIYQRISIKAANTVYLRLLRLYDQQFPSAVDILNTPDAALRSIGLPLSKIQSIKDLANKTLQDLPSLEDLDTLDDESVIQTLIRVKGIGRWSAQMVLIFQLKRLDVLPVDDLGLRAAMRDCYRLEALPDRTTVEAIAQRWKPYRTVATWYLWQTRSEAARELLKSWS